MQRTAPHFNENASAPIRSATIRSPAGPASCSGVNDAAPLRDFASVPHDYEITKAAMPSNFTEPRPQDAVDGRCGGVAPVAAHEASALEPRDGGLHGGFRQADVVGYGLVAGFDRRAATAVALPPQVQVHQKARCRAVVPDQVGHQYVDDVAVERQVCHGDEHYSGCWYSERCRRATVGLSTTRSPA